MMRKERVACMQWYNSRIVSVLKVLMAHVVHRRMKRNHYDELHARVCAAALLPIAIQRLSANCQVMLQLHVAATCPMHAHAFYPHVC
jgi:hypothetical protein